MGLMTLCVAMGGVMMGQPADAGTRVAVVNVAVVSEQYKRTSALEEQFEARRRELNLRREGYAKEIETLRRSLQEELKPGTPAFEERAKQLAQKEFEAQYFMEAEAKRVELGLAVSLRSIFDDIKGAIAAVAQERGFDVVLSADMMPQEMPDNTSQARQQILLQKVLYWNPQVDITDAVIERLNTEWQTKQYEAAQSSAAPADDAQPPAGEAVRSAAA